MKSYGYKLYIKVAELDTIYNFVFINEGILISITIAMEIQQFIEFGKQKICPEVPEHKV